MQRKAELALSASLSQEGTELHEVTARINAALATLSLAEIRQLVEEIEAVMRSGSQD